MRRTLLLSAFLPVLLTFAGATTASATQVVRYVSKHPLPKKIGRGFCYITVPHVHDYEPSDPRLYRQMDGQHYFVGDPAPFDYEGPRYSYYGAHPIADVDVRFGAPTYCYLRGGHYHWYAPPPQMRFELRGGAYWYVGNYEPVYYSDRPRFVVINDVYAPVVYTRPVIDVRLAPPAFRGEIVAVGPGVAAAAVVGAPVVSAGVHIAVPPPPVVHVGVGVGAHMGGPVVVGGGGPAVIGHSHDNGRHKGWQKRGPPPPSGGGWRGAPPPARNTGWRGAPPPAQSGGWRGTPTTPPPTARAGGFRGTPGPSSSLRGSPAAPQRAQPAAPRHNQPPGPGRQQGWRR
jgi:hypothetical protein